MVLTFPFVLKLNFACIVVPRDSLLLFKFVDS